MNDLEADSSTGVEEFGTEAEELNGLRIDESDVGIGRFDCLHGQGLPGALGE